MSEVRRPGLTVADPLSLESLAHLSDWLRQAFDSCAPGEAYRKTIVCSPAAAPAIRAALEHADWAEGVAIRESRIIPPGEAIVIDNRRLEDLTAGWVDW